MVFCILRGSCKDCNCAHSPSGKPAVKLKCNWTHSVRIIYIKNRRSRLPNYKRKKKRRPRNRHCGGERGLVAWQLEASCMISVLPTFWLLLHWGLVVRFSPLILALIVNQENKKYHQQANTTAVEQLMSTGRQLHVKHGTSGGADDKQPVFTV